MTEQQPTRHREPVGHPVGFIGLGTMGLPMALRLRERGDELVVWTRTAAKAAQIEGTNVHFVNDPATVARRCPVIVSCLLNDSAVAATYLGPDGVIAHVLPGALLAEHGTFSPALARRLASAAERRGARFLDSPVTGGSAGATAGTLIAMTGGTPESLARLLPVAAAYCASVELVGPVGAGAVLKLVNQMLVAAHAVSAAEAAELVRAAGIPVDVADRVLNGGWAASAMLARNLQPAVTRTHPEQGATIGLLADVLTLVRDAVASLAVPTVIQPVVYKLFQSAVLGGYSENDLSALPIIPDDLPAGTVLESQ